LVFLVPQEFPRNPGWFNPGKNPRFGISRWLGNLKAFLKGKRRVKPPRLMERKSQFPLVNPPGSNGGKELKRIKGPGPRALPG